MVQSRILIIDSNQIDARFIGSHLKSNSFDITLTSNTKDALNLVIRELPDLIILNSKGDEGMNFCRKIRQFTEIPIVVLSENPQKHEELNCLESGADDFIIKPFSVEILTLKIKAVIRRRKSSISTNSNEELQLSFNLN